MRNPARGERTVRWLMLALALALAGFVQWTQASLPAARELEADVRDALMRRMADPRPDPRLAIVDIDEESLRQLGAWPWPRERLAELAERLLADGRTSRVVFDLVLAEPGAGPEGRTGDARLAALAGEGLLVAAQAFDYEARDAAVRAGAVGGAIRLSAAPRPGAGSEAAAAAPARPSAGPSAASATGFVGSFAALAAGRCVGNIGFVPDADGRVRRLAPLTAWEGGLYPSLALAALACAQPPAAVGKVLSALPVDARGRWRVPFSRTVDSYLAVPAHRVLDGTLPDGLLAGRVALVGSSALGLSDRVATPLSASVAGVTVHAAALSELLDVAAGRARATPPAWVMPLWLVVSVTLLWWTVAGGGLGTIGLVGRAGGAAAPLRGGRLRHVLLALAVLLPAWLALAAWMTTTGRVQSVTAVLWGYGWILLAHLPLEWSRAQARLRVRTRLLSRYVARPVLEELLAAEGEDPLAPRRGDITVLIADMQDYTRLTSQSTLESAAQLTKGFLEQLTRPVLEHRGTLDRYTGDGLVSFWGAPIAIADHADCAIDAAVAILANVQRFNEARSARGLPPVTVRMGVASGSALVGDLGTPFRIAYTAVGDCINLASRLQQASREVGVNILVSGSVVQRCRRWSFTPMGTTPVRGLGDEPVFTPTRPPADADSPPSSAALPACG